MAWVTPQYSKDQVDAAGRALVARDAQTPHSIEEALKVINNWRSSHAFPLNTLQMNLRGKANEADGASLVAQRIKRLSSIEKKLSRFKWLTLSEMQDIGGCRAILRTVERVGSVVDAFKESRIKHRLLKEDDYIQNPKSSGYRGHHLIYSYYSDRNETYNGKKIEVQIRSRLQHTWATAVETVATFTGQALKSSQGEEDWLRFFVLVSSVFALKEKKPIVQNTSEDRKQLADELRHYVESLDIINRLRAYQAALHVAETNGTPKKHQYFLLELEPELQVMTVTSFLSRDLELASEQYLQAERRLQGSFGGDAVLVSVESLEALKRAYPNYFLDTSRFLQEVNHAIAKDGNRLAL